MPIGYRANLHFRQAPQNILSRVGARSFLVGEGMTTDPGRGGRLDYGFIDEAARIPWGEAVHTAAHARDPPRAASTTRRRPGRTTSTTGCAGTARPTTGFLRHHWSRHPVYARGLHVAARAPTRDEPRPKQPTQPDEVAAEIAADCDLCAGTREGLRWTAEEPHAHRYPGKLTSVWYERAIQDLTDEQVAQELDIDYAGSLPARVYTEF